MGNWLKTYHAQGHLAELIAALILRVKGYQILQRRYKTPLGEVDIIASRGKTLIAVEVKFRASILQAGEAISLKQRKRIEMALSLYLKRLTWEPQNIRFDAVYLIPYKWPKHIVSAWFVER